MSTKNKAFAKGAEVTLFNGYDSKGTIIYNHAVVYSCGAKQMVLTDAATGNELGRHFAPVCATEEDATTRSYSVGYEATFPRLTDEEATRIGLLMAARMIVNETAHYENCLSRHADYEAYCEAVRRDMALMHEPRVMDYTGRR
jgi:hypothetical protein